jgi:hypothetical protein
VTWQERDRGDLLDGANAVGIAKDRRLKLLQVKVDIIDSDQAIQQAGRVLQNRRISVMNANAIRDDIDSIAFFDNFQGFVSICSDLHQY